MHAHVTELMSLALDHEADAEQLRALQAHLNTCAECAATWTRWQALDAQFRVVPMLAPAPGLAARVMARLEARRQRQYVWGGWLGLLVAWGALIWAGLALLTFLACWAITHPGHAGLALAATARLLGLLVWPLRGLEIVLDSAGLSLHAVAAASLGLIAVSFWLWTWRVVRPAAARRARAAHRPAGYLSGGL